MAFICDLFKPGGVGGDYFFEMRPSFLGEEALRILIASCKNQVARVSGFWSLAKQTYKSWQPSHPESKALKDPSLFIYRKLAFADQADLKLAQWWKDVCVCVCVSSSFTLYNYKQLMPRNCGSCHLELNFCLPWASNIHFRGVHKAERALLSP